MKHVSFKQTESAMFNLDSLRTRLFNEWYETNDDEQAAGLQARIDEIEALVWKIQSGRMTRKEWDRVQELVAERKMQRYITCLNGGIDEKVAAGAFED